MRYSRMSARTVFLALLIATPLAHAAAVLTIRGKVYSVMKDELVLSTQGRLYYIRKNALPSHARDAIEKTSTSEIEIQVPYGAITGVKREESGAKAASR